MSSRRTVAGTPSRQTRSQSRANTPQAAPVLPAVNTAPIHSYGSRGKVALKHQVATANTDLAEVFEENRRRHHSEPISEEDEDIESESEADEPPSDDVLPGDRNGTVVGSTIIYDHAARRPSNRPSPTGDRLRGHGRESGTIPESDPPSPPGSSGGGDAGWPSWFSVFSLAFPRYLWRNLWALLLGGIILSVMLLIPLPDSLDWYRENAVHRARVAAGWSGWEHPPTELERRWQLFKHDANTYLFDLPPLDDPLQQKLINVHHFESISEVEYGLHYLKGNVTALQEYLPERLVVDLVDGQMVIKPNFWKSLEEQLAGSPTAFRAMISANQDAAERLIGRMASNYIDTRLATEVEVSRRGAVELMAKEHKSRMADVSRVLESFKHETLTDARAVALQAAQEKIESTLPAARDQFAIISKSVTLQNMVDAMHTVNYFNINRKGVTIDPHGSSPTATTPRSAFKKVFDYLRFPYKAELRQIHALTGWKEEGDCWCASPSPDKGKAQLAVMIPEQFIPSVLTIDHIPALGTDAIASAPRDFELWAETDSPAAANSTREQLTEVFAAYNQQTCASATPPTPNAICVGQGRYDIHGANWVQTFPLFTDLSKIGLTTKKVTFRATTNWGAEYTCIYRLRLSARENLDE